jgi:Tfp pilus assembly protein PilV
MKSQERGHGERVPAQAAYSLIEVVVAVMVLMTIATAFYLGLSSCFSVVKTSREEVRAAQIMTQKLEGARLCTWSELTNFTFKEPYDPVSGTNFSGVYYYGRFVRGPATNVSSSASYRDNMYLVTVSLTWTNNRGTGIYNREMQTHYARYGLQSYIWGAIQ